MLKFLWEDIPEVIEGYRPRAEEFTDLGKDRVLVVARYEGHGKSSGAEVNLRLGSVYELQDGMVATVRDYGSREEALKAAGLSE